MRPIALTPNQPRQFYRGGSALGAFRGQPAQDDHRPEDWIGSATRRHGAAGDDGLTTLPDGRLLRDALASEPEAWLGAAHAAALGADPALLVKLLDAGERLPVHVHPARPFARRHLASNYGKTEAWIVLAADGPDARVHLGFKRDVDAAELDRWMDTRDTQAMLDNLNALDVRAGDAVFVPAGLPHAIGAGIFCLELQEPSDFSVMLEWEGFDQLDPLQARLGLDPQLARQCVQREALQPDRLAWLRSRGDRPSRNDGGVVQLFPEDADPFFRAERIQPPDQGAVEMPADFAVLVVLEGHGQLESEHDHALVLERGSTTLVPHGAGETRLSGPLVAVRCRPPSAESALVAGLGQATGADLAAGDQPHPR